MAKRKDQKYCNDTCRADYYEEHYFVKKYVDKVCPQCGDTFSTSMPKKQTYCKPECRENAAKVRAGKTVEQQDAERATYIGDRYATLERDGFKCTVCGRGAKDGARLEVVDEGGQLRTICTECAEGRRLSHVKT